MRTFPTELLHHLTLLPPLCSAVSEDPRFGEVVAAKKRAQEAAEEAERRAQAQEAAREAAEEAAAAEARKKELEAEARQLQAIEARAAAAREKAQARLSTAGEKAGRGGQGCEGRRRGHRKCGRGGQCRGEGTPWQHTGQWEGYAPSKCLSHSRLGQGKRRNLNRT
jgi:hypothetical protein